MHPADESMRSRPDRQRQDRADVAARFGVTETLVLKRMKLARVSPVILQVYRDDKITLRMPMAFASPRPARQRSLENRPPPGSSQRARIRDHLTEHEIDAGDRRVRLVTLRPTRKPAAPIRRDLFAEAMTGSSSTHPVARPLVADQLEKTPNHSARKAGNDRGSSEKRLDTRAKFRRVKAPKAPCPKNFRPNATRSRPELKTRSEEKPVRADEDRVSEIEDRIYDLNYERRGNIQAGAHRHRRSLIETIKPDANSTSW